MSKKRNLKTRIIALLAALVALPASANLSPGEEESRSDLLDRISKIQTVVEQKIDQNEFDDFLAWYDWGKWGDWSNWNDWSDWGDWGDWADY